MYNIKVYDIDGNYKKTIGKELIIVGDFSAQINGSLSSINIDLKLPITDNTYNIGDFIKIYLKGKIIYSGNIFFIKRFLKNTYEYIQLQCVSIFGFMKSYSLSKNYISQKSSDIVKDIVNNYNTLRGQNILNYDNTSIPDSSDSISVNVSKSYLENLQELQKVSSINFFITASGKVFYKNKDSFPNHRVAVSKHIGSIEIGQADSNLVKNDKVYNTIKIILNNKYDYRDIKPGDTIKVQNTKYEINNLIVAKINYSLKEAKIELENFNSFSDLVLGN